MTITGLIKELNKIKKKVGPRTQVVVNMEALRNRLPYEYSHASFNHVEVECIPWAVNDSVCLANGEERTKVVVSIGGVA